MAKTFAGHPWRVVIVCLAGVMLGLVAFSGVQVWVTFDRVSTEDFDPEAARLALGLADSNSAVTFVEPAEFEPELPEDEFAVVDPSVELLELQDIRDLSQAFLPRDLSPFSFGEPIPDEMFTSYLLTGTDASGFLADVIILALQPEDGGDPIMVSLPRDLYVWNECKNTFTRLNAGLGGCTGVASGMEMIALLVEDYTGIPIDHVARTSFSGFEKVVDSMGGTTICVDYPSRDWRSGLDIPAGCRRADGATTLAWVRSRHTEQYIGGRWKQVVGSDYARQARQQDVLFQLAAKVARFSTPASLVRRLAAVSSAVRLDSSWTFGQAVSTAWRYRGIDRGGVLRFSIEASNYRTPGGSQVLLPAGYFRDQLAEVFPLGETETAEG